MLYYDTETVGFHGVAVLLQYAVDEGPITLWNIWKEPISETLEIIEWIMSQEVCGFNLAFDHFHLCKIYTMFSMFPDHSALPEDHIEELAIIEEQARFSDWCIKPKAALDLMLHGRKGPLQSLMDRHAIRVRKVPTRLADAVRDELEANISLDGIYFARRTNPNAPQWVIRDTHFPDGEINPAFKNIVLKLQPSGALKVLAERYLGYSDPLKMKNIGVHKKFLPKEVGWAPFAMAIGRPGRWNWSWPDVIANHISHWAHNRLAKRYAEDDVVYTRKLHHYFDDPPAGDDDSELACAVGANRWRGFTIDVPALQEQRALAIAKRSDVPTSAEKVKVYLKQVMNDLEAIVLNDGTGKVILESIAEWENEAGTRAQAVLDARGADKEIELFDKLIQAGHFHASFKVIGALSSRMSGADKLNPQGIKNTKVIRSCFPLAHNGMILSGGDFVSFEIVIMEADYNDPRLRKDLLSGKKIHTLFGMELSGKTYEEVLASKGTDDDLYDKGKRGIYGVAYGGNEDTLVRKVGVTEERAHKAFEGFGKKYKGFARARQFVYDNFCSMRQPGGIGTKVVWADPTDYMETLLGFRRYFTLENQVCKSLFEMANNPPKTWKDVRIKVQRRDRLQTAAGATMSALYAAAFNVQASNMRAAANHRIQGTGAGITKNMQRRIWDLQPAGAAPWRVQVLNIHDEVMAPCVPELADRVAEVVDETVEHFKPQVPLLEMDWTKELRTWADK